MAAPDDTFYWDWYKHEEALATNRGSFFLVGQSMLFAGYAALRAADATATFAIVLFCLTGLLIGITWLLVGVMHLVGTRRPLVRLLNQHEPRRAAIAGGPGGAWPSFLRSFHVMAIFLPALICAMWILLLFA